MYISINYLFKYCIFIFLKKCFLEIWFLTFGFGETPFSNFEITPNQTDIVVLEKMH